MKEKQHAQIIEISEEVKWMSHMIGSVDWNHVAQQKSDPILKRIHLEENRTIFTSKYFTVSYETNGTPIWTKNVGGKNLTLIFHGRLYNKQQLKNELLANGYTFETNSDMEIVFYSYVEWGNKSLEKLNGAYAFALWNEDDEQLLLARDRLGMKRLFYKMEANRLYFSTNFQDLIASCHHRPRLQEESIAHLLAFRSVRSFYNGINEVAPAHALLYDRRGITSYCYWNLVSDHHLDGIYETADKLRHLLVEIVETELAEEKVVSTICSPNVASFILIALASNVRTDEGTNKLRTYSFHEADEKFTNSLQLYRTEQINVTFSVEELNKIMTERSIVDDSFIPLEWYEHLRIQQILQNEPTTILAEAGVDEAFATTNAFIEEERELSIVRQFLDKASYLHDKWRKNKKLIDYVEEKYDETVNRTPLLIGESKREVRRRQFSYVQLQWKLLPLLQQLEKSYEIANKKVYFPFADYRFIEYVWNVPTEMKQLDGYNNGILRKGFEGIVPAQILYRKNENDRIKNHSLFELAVVEKMKALLAQKDSPLFDLFDKKKVEQLIKIAKHEEQAVRATKTMFDMIQFEVLLKQLF